MKAPLLFSAAQGYNKNGNMKIKEVNDSMAFHSQENTSQAAGKSMQKQNMPSQEQHTTALREQSAAGVSSANLLHLQKNMGNRAVTQLMSAQGVVQRKIAIEDNAGSDDILEYCKSKMLYYVSPSEIMDEVMKEKPPHIKEQLEQELLLGFSFSKLNSFLEDWHKDGKSFTYSNDSKGFNKLAKDAVKYHLNKHYNWRSIGTAEYMTGDATGLAMVPLVDSGLTVKVLTGDQRKAPSHPEKAENFLKDPPPQTEINKRIQGPSFLKNREQLPEYFDAAQRAGGIAFSQTDDNRAYQGTSDRYSTVYNEHTPGAVKPWNKETYEATRVIGEALHDPEKTKVLREQIQLGSSEGDQALKLKIEEYKKVMLDPVLKGKQCLILWGRNSGQKGGAHKELDSHQLMVFQLAAKLKASFPARQLVFVGDEVVTKEELGARNEVVHLGEFWKPQNSGEEYAPSLRDRNAQRYLFQLLHQENDAVSIGMRSGSLEGMALLGLNVIFIDDKDNNAAGRMEFWAGDAADERAAALSGHEDDFEEQAAWEKSKEGPLQNYKRISTVQKMGDEIDKRYAVLQRGITFYRKLLSERDHTDSPVCTSGGTDSGIKMTADILSKREYADTFFANKMTDKPAVISAFLKEYDSLVNTISSVNYKGKAAVTRASSFKFNEANIRKMMANIAQLDESPEKTHALSHLHTILEKKDVTLASLAGEWGDSKGAETLLRNIAADAPSSKQLQAFNASFDKVKSGFDGKSEAAAAGKIKFKIADINSLHAASELLVNHNALQTNEKDQVSFLVKYLSPDKKEPSLAK